MQALIDMRTDYNAYDNVSAMNIQALSMVPFINPWGMTTDDERRAMKQQSTVMENAKLDEACCYTATALA